MDPIATLLRATALFVLTAVAEIIGCYLPWLVLKQDRSPWCWRALKVDQENEVLRAEI